jgi:hypothetical protein
MLLANKEAVMTVLDTLNFVAFNPLQNNNPIAVRRRKLIAKIDEQIQLAANKDYTPTQQKWVCRLSLPLPLSKYTILSTLLPLFMPLWV